MSSTPVTPTASSASPLDFSHIEGHIEHAWDDVKNLVTTGDTTGNPQATEGDAAQEMRNNETQRAGEQQYSDFLYKNDPQEYRQADPVGYVGRKLEDAVTAPMEKNRTPEEQAVIDPGAKEVAGAGLGAYGVPPNGSVGRTEGMQEGTVMPEGEGAIAEPELAQGGHAGGGVASVEELNRPGRFVKVGRSGQLTDQGKVPDFNLQHGEAGYQVTPQGYELKAGQETPATKMGVDKYHKTVFKGGEKKPFVSDVQGPPIEKAGIIQNAHKILNHPESTAEDKGIATRQLEHQHATRFEDEPKAITYRTDNNGTRWAKIADSPAEVSIPKGMNEKDVEKYATDKLDLQKNFAQSRTDSAPSSSEPPKRYRITNTKTGESFGNFGDKARASRAMDVRDNIYGGYTHKVEEIPRGTAGNRIKPTDSDSPMAQKALAKD